VCLATFVQLLRWLLDRHEHPTLVVVIGLMAGSLRALWPWQTEDRTLLPPGDDLLAAVLLGVAGAVLVAGLITLEVRLSHLLHDPELDPIHPHHEDAAEAQPRPSSDTP
jgi:putative membrane protein